MRTDAVLEPFAAGLAIPLRPAVAEWAEERIRFDTAIDASPRYILEKSPYAGQVFAWWNEPAVEEIFLLWPTQSSKTTTEIVLIAYLIENDPGPFLFAMAEKDPTEAFIQTRLKPTLKYTFPGLISESQRSADWTERKGGWIGRAHIWPAWGTSEGRLRSWPRRYIFGDETSLWDCSRHVALERTKQFPRNRKALWATTPTLPGEQSWLAATKVFKLHRWWVPCPHCATLQVLKMKNVIFEHCRDEAGVWDLEKVEAETFYRCPHCKEEIRPNQRAALLQAGQVLVEDPKTEDMSRRQVSLRITCLDVPNITWGESARKFLESKASPDDLKNFVNSWLVEPWEPRQEGVRAVKVLARSQDYKSGEAPADTSYILASIDTQRSHVWVCVRAFMKDERSVLIEAVRIDGKNKSTEDALEKAYDQIVTKVYPRAGADEKESVPIMATVVDCGDGDTAAIVYRFAYKHFGRVQLIRGNPGRIQVNTWRVSKIEKYPDGTPLPGALPLYLVKTEHYRERVIGAYLQSMAEAGAWLAAKGTPAWYGDHLESWQIIEEQLPKGRGIIKRWKQLRRDDHALDCEAYISAFSDILKYVPKKQKKPVERRTSTPIRRNYSRRQIRRRY